MIRADDIVKTFGKNEVLRGVSLEVSKGEIISIIGPSGSGKSTFLRSLIGLEQINGGSIYINGMPFVKDGIYQSERDTRPLLMQMGMVFGRDLYTLKTQIRFEYLRYSHSLVFFEDPSVLQSEESMFFWYCCTGPFVDLSDSLDEDRRGPKK